MLLRIYDYNLDVLFLDNYSWFMKIRKISSILFQVTINKVKNNIVIKIWWIYNQLTLKIIYYYIIIFWFSFIFNLIPILKCFNIKTPNYFNFYLSSDHQTWLSRLIIWLFIWIKYWIRHFIARYISVL